MGIAQHAALVAATCIPNSGETMACGKHDIPCHGTTTRDLCKNCGCKKTSAQHVSAKLRSQGDTARDSWMLAASATDSGSCDAGTSLNSCGVEKK